MLFLYWKLLFFRHNKVLINSYQNWLNMLPIVIFLSKVTWNYVWEIILCNSNNIGFIIIERFTNKRSYFFIQEKNELSELELLFFYLLIKSINIINFFYDLQYLEVACLFNEYSQISTEYWT